MQEVNDAPTISAVGPLTFAENTVNFTPTPNNTQVVASLSATDLEGDTLSNWQIVSGNTNVDGDSNNAFIIDTTTGEITVNDADDLDFEQSPIFSLGVTVSDGTDVSAVETITINLTDLLDGTTGNDRLDGNAANDQIDGLDGNDDLYGYSGTDTLFGGSGRDFLYGGSDNDVLNGGDGNDVLNGGDGNDVLIDEGSSEVVNADAAAFGKITTVTKAYTSLGEGWSSNDRFSGKWRMSMAMVGLILSALPIVQSWLPWVKVMGPLAPH